MRVTLVILFLTLGVINGCSSQLSSGGEDIEYLKDLKSNEQKIESKPLLPLSPGKDRKSVV